MSELEFERPLDPFKLKNVEFVSYEKAGFTMDEISRLCLRGFEVQCFRVPGDPIGTLRINFPVLSDTPADRFNVAMQNGFVEEDDAIRFLNDARYLESDVSFAITWSDYA